MDEMQPDAPLAVLSLFALEEPCHVCISSLTVARK
jgi:hypothetical protein